MARNGLDRIALILVIIGAIVWLSVGLFQFDFVAALFGGCFLYSQQNYIFCSRSCRNLFHQSALQKQGSNQGIITSI